MIQSVMPKKPFRAVQYTGANDDEIIAFTDDLAERRSDDEFVPYLVLLPDIPEPDAADVWYTALIEAGMWILEVPRQEYGVGGRLHERPAYILIEDEDFCERWSVV